MDLHALDRRLAARAIEEDVQRMNSRPIHISIVEGARSMLESELSYLLSLRTVATSEEAAELDAKMELKRAHLERICAELTARSAADQIAPPDSDGAIHQKPTINWKDLFCQIIQKRRFHGESDTVLLRDWLKEHQGISRSQVYDFLAGRIKGRVSDSKCEKIRTAILTSAEQLGLPTRINSD
jgi:hypothetical protein